MKVMTHLCHCGRFNGSESDQVLHIAFGRRNPTSWIWGWGRNQDDLTVIDQAHRADWVNMANFEIFVDRIRMGHTNSVLCIHLNKIQECEDRF